MESEAYADTTYHRCSVLIDGGRCALQVRVPIAEIQALLPELMKGRTWESMQQQYPTHASAADDN